MNRLWTKAHLGSAEPGASLRDESKARAAGVGGERQGWIAGGVHCRVSNSTISSHTMYKSNGLRKSTPIQNRQDIVYY